jgi:hypothetical protein
MTHSPLSVIEPERLDHHHMSHFIIEQLAAAAFNNIALFLFYRLTLISI